MRVGVRVVLAAVAWLVARLPWRALGALGGVLGWVAGSVVRVRRGQVERAMRRAGVGAPHPAAVARAMYRGLGAGVMELLWLAGASADRRTRAIREAVAIDREALGDGPVVVAASHTGNWELAAYAAARLRPLAVVAKPLSVGGFDAFCTQLRGAAGLTLLPPRGALGAARRVLAAGGVVAMPIDQVPDASRHALVAPFLGADALCDRAPATLAWRSGATLLVVASTREASGHRVHVLARLRPEGTNGRAWIEEATRKATAALEAFVRESPSSWLWLHRRWRSPRASAPASALRLVASPHPG